MSKIDDGGPALPMQDPQAIHAYAMAAVEGITDPDERDRAYLKARAEAVGGASLRDYFAVHLTTAAYVEACERPRTGDLAADVAHKAYLLADAMLAARKGPSS